MASGRGKKGSAKRRNGSEHYGIPAGGRSSRERRAATWIAQHSANARRRPDSTNHPDNTAVSGTRITEVPVLRRKAFLPRYIELETVRNSGSNIWKSPQFEIVHEALGRYAVRRFGYTETTQIVQRLIPTYDTTISIDAKDVVPERGRSGMFFVSIVPDEASQELLYIEKLQASDALESTKPPERRPIRIASNLSENAAERLCNAITQNYDPSNVLLFGAPVMKVIDQTRR